MKKFSSLLIRLIKNNFLHFKIRLFKLYKLLKFPILWRFIPSKIMPSFEHLEALKNIKKINSLIDCGSNKGQFAILIYAIFRIKNYLSFDPIKFPSKAYKFFKNKKVKAKHKKIALSHKKSNANFYITEREDSSSLKKIIDKSYQFCPDVFYKKTISVKVELLDSYINEISKLPKPLALKIDVQGSEYELLLGAINVLKLVDFIFIEISFESLYENTSPSFKIFDILNEVGFKQVNSYNPFVRNGKLLSKDYLFKKA